MGIKIALTKLIFKNADRKRDKGTRPASGLTGASGIVYARDPDRTLSVWYPEGTDRKLPVIVVVHGGGYIYGSDQIYSHYSKALAGYGFAVVCFNYRLAPGYKFPCPVIDLNECLKWIVNGEHSFPFDDGNVFLAGDSAGAQIASQYGVIYSSREYAEIMEITPPDFRLAGMALNCGMYDIPLISVNSPPSSRHVMNAYFTKNPLVYGEKINALKYLGDNYPPCFVVSSPGDFLLAHFAPMMELLKDRGVYTKGGLYGNENTRHVFHLAVGTELAQKVNGEETDFFRSLVK